MSNYMTSQVVTKLGVTASAASANNATIPGGTKCVTIISNAAGFFSVGATAIIAGSTANIVPIGVGVPVKVYPTPGTTTIGLAAAAGTAKFGLICQY